MIHPEKVGKLTASRVGLHSCVFRRQVEDCSDEGRIWVRKSIVLLFSPSAGLNIVDTRYVGSPACLSGHLVELAVLNRHGMNDPQGTFVTREESSTTSQSVSLQ